MEERTILGRYVSLLSMISMILLGLSFIVCSCNWGINSEGIEDGADLGEGRVEVIDLELEITGDEFDGVDILPEDLVVEGDVEEDGEVEVEVEIRECTGNADCEDDEPCNGQETCDDDGFCRPGTPLDDETPCSTPDVPNGICRAGACVAGRCGNAVLEPGEECDDGNSVSGDGCEGDCTFSCHVSPDCDDGNVCTDEECVEGGNGQICTTTFNTSPCDDGLFCTVNDVCDGAGLCAGSGNPCDDSIDCTTDNCDEDTDSCPDPAPQDAICPSGQYCVPGCAGNSSGCMAIPSGLNLSCTTPATIPSSSDCNISLDGMSGQSGCLNCSASAGFVVLDRADFGDDTGACELDGWRLLQGTGNLCTARVDGCNPRQNANCCDSLATLCTNLNGNFVMRGDRALNCGGGVEEFRLVKSFDTTGFSNLEICFDYGETGANANDGIIVVAADGTNTAQVYCLNGEPRPGVNGVLYPLCASLPAWAGNNSNLEITIIIHSETNNHALYLDDVVVKGWISTCSPNTLTIFSENFSGCPGGVIPDNWNGWAVTGSPACPGTWNCGGSGNSAQSSGNRWVITRNVDTSAVDGDVILCFSIGDTAAGAGDSVLVEFDSGDGGGWKTAWSQMGNLGGDGTCGRICVDLSLLDSGVAMNPSVGLRFTVETAAGHQINLDDISLSGAVYCNAGGIVSIGAVSDNGGGFYSFSVSDTFGKQLSTRISCIWDGSDRGINDFARVDFIN